MKFLKLTLLAILSVVLLTAVLPSSGTEPTIETSNHDINKPEVKLSSVFNKKGKTETPTNG